MVELVADDYNSPDRRMFWTQTENLCPMSVKSGGQIRRPVEIVTLQLNSAAMTAKESGRWEAESDRRLLTTGEEQVDRRMWVRVLRLGAHKWGEEGSAWVVNDYCNEHHESRTNTAVPPPTDGEKATGRSTKFNQNTDRGR